MIKKKEGVLSLWGPKLLYLFKIHLLKVQNSIMEAQAALKDWRLCLALLPPSPVWHSHRDAEGNTAQLPQGSQPGRWAGGVGGGLGSEDLIIHSA